MKLFFAGLLTSVVALSPASDEAPPRLELRSSGMGTLEREARDEAVLLRACPGAVSFCTEWKEKWSQDAPDPSIRNQTVAECVVDMMSAITDAPWPPEGR